MLPKKYRGCKISCKKNKLKINYKVASPEKLKTKTKFDVIFKHGNS